jgi:hypothetical protein
MMSCRKKKDARSTPPRRRCRCRRLTAIVGAGGKGKIISIFLFFLFSFSLSAQIRRLEYFVDYDPGVGKAVRVEGFTQNQNVEVPVSGISSSGLSEGLHRVFVRAQDFDGRWSVTQSRSFVRVKLRVLPEVQRLEYFIDDDPGFGAAHAVGVTGFNVDKSLNVLLDESGSGMHTLYIRALNVEGRWSLAQSRTFQQFYVRDVASLNALEWFIDDDPGFGAAARLPLAGASADRPFAVDVSGVNAGMHTLYVRGRNSSMQWGLTHSIAFVKASVSAETNITRLEYFIDDDPGVGAAIPVSVGTPDRNVTAHFTVSDALSEGLHTLYLRARNEEGNWSVVQRMDFLKAADAPVDSVEYLEYFIDDDPGFGKAAGISVSPSATVIQPFTVNLSGLSSGMHRLYLRARNTAGRWSITQHHPFVKVSLPENRPVTALEWFIDDDPGFSAARQLTLPASETEKIFHPSLDSLPEGIHTLYIRARTAAGQWSVTQHITVYSFMPPDAADVVRMEYFVAAPGAPDPGFGAAAPIPTTPGQRVAATFQVNLPPDAPEGLYRFCVRAMNGEGRWSITQYHPFVKVKLPENRPVTALEWFIDDDPGFGAAHQVPLSASETEKLFNASFDTLPAGLHTLWVRARNAAGQWSVTQHIHLFRTMPPDAPNIVRMEYFIARAGDPIPDFGAATPIPVTPGQRVAATFQAVLPTGANEGFYLFYVRAMDDQGHWSVTQRQGFLLNEKMKDAGTAAVEYFMDDDPGFGAATRITAADGQLMIPLSGNYSEGAHTFYVRAMNERGEWGVTQSLPLLVAQPPDVAGLTALEWFIDEDPGFRNAAPIPIVPDRQQAASSFFVPLSGTGAGVHTFYVRAVNTQGDWSITHRQTFIVAEFPAGRLPKDLVRMEWFMDDDPGFGAAQKVTVSGLSAQASFTVTPGEADLTPGFHTLYLRAENSAGQWSVTQTLPVMVAELPADYAIPDVTALEWFIDDDPGFRNGHRIPVPQPGQQVRHAFSVPTATLLPGIHTFYVRALNEKGDWSITHRQIFIVGELPPDRLPKDLTQLEWFMDDDPGFGAAEKVNLSGLSAQAFFTVTPGEADLTPGFHTLCVRGKNSAGQWGVTQIIPVMVAELPANYVIPDVTAVEWFIDVDPGFRLAHRVPLPQPGQQAQHAFAVPLSAFAPGMHTFYVRAINAKGDWSITHRQTFIIGDLPSDYLLPGMARLEYFIDRDPGFGEATPVGLLDQTSTATAFDVDLDSVEDGPHVLYVRAINKNGQWSHTQTIAFYRTDQKINWKKEIVRLEYFIDNDPGFGAGTPVVTGEYEDVDVSVFIPLNDVWPGVHEISFRALDVRGYWSHTHSISLMVIDNPNLGGMSDVVELEWFIDDDPGFGAANAVAIARDVSINERFFVDVTGLPEGLHTLYIRARNSREQWGHTHGIDIYNSGIPQFRETKDITAFEYFINRDPGFGAGQRTAVLPAAPDVQQQITVNVDTLPSGLHTIFVRAQDNTGAWSHTNSFSFVRAVIPPNYAVTALEYFIDHDPGFGAATPVSVPAGANIDRMFNVTLPDSLPVGTHTLYVRTCNENGEWSVTQHFDFVSIRFNSPDKIVAVEYFVDDDPGFGAAVPLPGVVPGVAVDRVFAVDVSAFTVGMHTLYVRARSENNRWSVTQNMVFVTQKLYESDKTEALEWFIDDDPGFGAAYAVSLSPTIAATVTIPIPSAALDGIDAGMHTLYIRARNSKGKWSVTQNIEFLKAETPKDVNVTAIEWFIDDDPGFGQSPHRKTFDPPQSQVVWTTPVNTASLSAGLHALSVRARNENGDWSVTQYEYFVKTEVLKDTVAALEWFIDDDPGFGAANAATPGANIHIPVDTLSAGLHTLYLRARSGKGQWSVTQDVSFLKMEAQKDVDITALEWFIDDDPGFGQSPYRKAFDPPQNHVVWTTPVNTASLSAGLHALYVRARNENGDWSVTQYEYFVKTNAPKDTVAALEWFIDDDPGFGAANAATPGANIHIPVNTLADGIHTLYLRAKNGKGEWSVTQNLEFIKAESPKNINITAIEWFIDHDPGFGQSPDQKKFDTPQNQVVWTTPISTASLSAGLHTLYVRACNENGDWGITQYACFVKTDRPTDAVAALEWFIDDDPGFGAANAAMLGANIPIPVDTLADGLHTLYVRAKSVKGQWSITHSLIFCKVSHQDEGYEITGFEWFLDDDPGFGAANHVHISGNAHDFVFDVSGITEGWHTLYMRARNSNQEWSITQDIALYHYTDTSTVSGIVALEWFIDHDPGFGKAQGVVLGDTVRQLIRTFTVDISTLNEGMHTFYVRALNDSSRWSITQHQMFAIIKSHDIDALEWFIDNDLGIGANHVVSVSPAASVNTLIAIPDTEYDEGAHTLYVRAHSIADAWSLTQTFDFYSMKVHAPPYVARIEYFFDTDPGFGAAATIHIGGVSSATVNFTAQMPAESPLGLHTLYVRAQDTLGHWGHTQYGQFIKVKQPQSPNTVALEWFMDDDPGFGAANRVPVVAGNAVTRNITFTDAPEGIHTFYVRALNEDGRWSVTQYLELLVTDMTSEKLAKAVAAEYFFDTDPGFGKATPIPGVAPSENTVRTFAVTLPPDMKQGLHTFYARALNEDGRWSITQYAQFVKTEACQTANTVALEWFIDDDPGVGAANGITLVPAAAAVTHNITLTAVPEGIHTLYIRALNAEGRWSVTQYLELLVTDISAEKIAKTVAAEYFFDTDPGFGKATPIPGVAPAENTVRTFAVTLPSDMSPGVHAFYARARNEEGRWSITQYAQFVRVNAYQAPNTVALEWFMDDDPGFGAANSITLVPATAAVHNITLTGVPAGMHTFYVRALNTEGLWSVTQYLELMVTDISTEEIAKTVAAEYFFDTDPGFGAATPIPGVTPEENLVRTFAVALPSNMAPGVHTFYVRARNEEGRWSITQYVSFLKIAVRVRPEIVAAEYFIDHDPGFGAAVRLPVAPAATAYTLSFNIAADQIGAGAHTLYIRTLDNEGQWSITHSTELVVIAAVTQTPNIMAIEYFFDTDPGFGAANPISVSPAAKQTTRNFFISVDELSPGAHTLYLRSLNEDSVWSITHYYTIVKMDVNARLADAVRIEYFIDDDPGFGAGKPVPVSPDVNVNKIFMVDLSGVVTAADLANPAYNSEHTLYVRALASDGEWAVTQTINLKIVNMPPIDTGDQPQGGAVSPALTEVCEGSVPTVDLRAESFSKRVGGWETRVIYDNGTSSSWTTVSGSTGKTLLSVAPNTAGTWQYRTVIYDGDRGPEYSTIGEIKVISAAEGGKALSDAPQYVCIGTSFHLTLENYKGDVVRWQKRNLQANDTSWIDINATTNALTVMPDAGGTWEYRAEVEMGECSSEFSENATVNVVSSLTGGEITPSTLSVCTGKPFQLKAENFIGAIVKWQRSDDDGTTWNDLSEDKAEAEFTLAAVGVYHYRVAVKAGTCDETYSQAAVVTALQEIEAAQAISGNDLVCAPARNVRYAVPTIDNADEYVWTLPSGASFASVSNSNEIFVDFSTAAISGNITVKGVNASCGAGDEATKTIEVQPRPVIIGNIIGETNVCIGQPFTYEIPAVNGNVSYQWTVSTGWSVLSYTPSHVITIMPNALGGTVSVTVTDNQTGCVSDAVTLDVFLMPSSETGPIYRLPNSL